MGEVIAFLSGKGGTGKSSVCAAVATALVSDGRRVLCIDADIGLRNLDVFLGISEQDALSFADICRGDYPLHAAPVHPAYSALSFLTAPIHADAGDISPDSFAALLQQARHDFDFVLIDGPSGLGDGMRFAATAADRCIMVTLPDPASIRSVERAAQELEKMEIKNVRLIVNRVYRDLLKAMGKNIDDVMDTIGLPLLGIVPTDPNISLAAAHGKPLLQYTRLGAAAACKRIAKRIQGHAIPL